MSRLIWTAAALADVQRLYRFLALAEARNRRRIYLWRTLPHVLSRSRLGRAGPHRLYQLRPVAA